MKNRFESLDEWYRSSAGAWLLAREREYLVHLLPGLPGNCLIEMGGVDAIDLGPRTQMTQRAHLVAQNSGQSGDVVADFSELPLLPHHADVIIICHLLEFVADPWIMLAEIYEALAEGGRLVIFGFNPYSVSGLRRFLRSTGKRGQAISPAKVARQLSRLHFSINTLHYDRYFPTSWGWRFLSDLGIALLPFLAGSYCLVAQKKVQPVIPAKKMWQRQRNKRRERFLKPTARMDRHD